MKKRGLFVAVAVLFTASAWAQENSAEKIFKEYAGNGECTTLTVNKNVLNLVADLKSEEPEVRKFIAGLENVKILASEKTLSRDSFNELSGKLSGTYDEWMTVNQKDEQVRFLVKREGDVIKELVLLTNGGEGESAMIIVKGKISMRELMKMKNGAGDNKGELAFLMDL